MKFHLVGAARLAVVLLGALACLTAPLAQAQTSQAQAGQPQTGLRLVPLTIATHKGLFRFQVEVANNDATREQGLMFRKSLAADRGMLFDFKTPQPVAFWMKNTLIPLDMLFVAADGHIVSVVHDAAPLSETPIPSGGEILGVVELKGGRAAQIDAEPGDAVRADIFHP